MIKIKLASSTVIFCNLERTKSSIYLVVVFSNLRFFQNLDQVISRSYIHLTSYKVMIHSNYFIYSWELNQNPILKCTKLKHTIYLVSIYAKIIYDFLKNDGNFKIMFQTFTKGIEENYCFTHKTNYSCSFH